MFDCLKLRTHEPVGGRQCPPIQAVHSHLFVCLERQTDVYGLPVWLDTGIRLVSAELKMLACQLALS